jgi:hypothetical protein
VLPTTFALNNFTAISSRHLVPCFAQVLDTIVEKVSGSPGEDRAIVMIGYEHEMQAMFRGSNPGLSRRFDSHHPWHFTDFTDDDLLQVAVDHLGPKAGIVPLHDYLHMVKKVSELRMLHNFGNAGVIKTVRGCETLRTMTCCINSHLFI